MRPITVMYVTTYPMTSLYLTAAGGEDKDSPGSDPAGRDRAMQLQRDGCWGMFPSLVSVTGVAVEIEGRVEPFKSVKH